MTACLSLRRTWFDRDFIDDIGVGGEESDYYHPYRDDELFGSRGAGVVASLARPGGNVTGLSGLAVELNTKRLEILKDAVSKLFRVGLLRPVESSIATDLQLKELRLRLWH